MAFEDVTFLQEQKTNPDFSCKLSLWIYLLHE